MKLLPTMSISSDSVADQNENRWFDEYDRNPYQQRMHQLTAFPGSSRPFRFGASSSAPAPYQQVNTTDHDTNEISGIFEESGLYAGSEFDAFLQSSESGSESFREDSYVSGAQNGLDPFGFALTQLNEERQEKTQFQVEVEEILHRERKNHLMQIHQTFVGLWRTGTLCDIILKTVDTVIPVHSAVVVGHSGRCEKEAMDFNKTKPLPIVIALSSEVALGALKQLVDFMYLAKLEIELTSLIAVYKAAKELEVYVVVARCNKIMERLLEDQNIIQTIQATTELGADDLQEVAWSKFTKDFKLFYQREAFLEQSLQAVTKVLSSNFLVPKSEFEVFEAAVAWINHRRHERLKYLPRLMECVRLIYLTDEELINCMQYDEAFAVSPGLEILAQANMSKMLKDRGELPPDAKPQKQRARNKQPEMTQHVEEGRYGAFRNSMMTSMQQPQSVPRTNLSGSNAYQSNPFGQQTTSGFPHGGPVLMAQAARARALSLTSSRSETPQQNLRYRGRDRTPDDLMSGY